MEQFRVIYDTANFIDSVPCTSFQDAVETASNIMLGWVEGFSGDSDPQECRDKWDYMIDSCSTWAEVYNSQTGEWECCWEPDQTLLDDWGWTSTDSDSSEYWNLFADLEKED